MQEMKANLTSQLCSKVKRVLAKIVKAPFSSFTNFSCKYLYITEMGIVRVF